MSHATVTRSGDVAVVTLCRGKVNAVNEATVDELDDRFHRLDSDAGVGALVITGEGSFFSFGFDIPEFLSYTKDEFLRFLTKFTALYTRLFIFPKPVVAALNGHTIAGGCMLATACDRRIMASDRGKISLNEITFGASVFAGCVEMLKACAGPRKAETILHDGGMYRAGEALALGLIDRAVPSGELLDAALDEAAALAAKDGVAFRSIKNLLRAPIAAEMRQREGDSIREFADIWYSESTWARLQGIKIRQ